MFGKEEKIKKEMIDFFYIFKLLFYFEKYVKELIVLIEYW